MNKLLNGRNIQLMSIEVGGFRNIDESVIEFKNKITALVAHNSYGKSNIIDAIDFSITYMHASPRKRDRLMSLVSCIPLNIKVAKKNFSVNYKLFSSVDGNNRIINYGFEFIWEKNAGRRKKNENGRKIVKEWMFITDCEGSNKTIILDRNDGSTKLIFLENYDASLSDHELVINRLLGVHDWEYAYAVEAILSLKILVERHFDASAAYGRNLFEKKEERGMDSDILDNIPRLVYRLKNKYPDKYSSLEDAFLQLFPSIKAIDVQEIDLGERHGLKMPDDVPFKIPDKFYSLYVLDNNLNQPLNFNGLSDGTKRIFLMLVATLVADIKNYNIIVLEEPENSIHPNLLQHYIEVVSMFAGSCRVLMASHSPYIVDYMNMDSIYIGCPSSVGVADFRLFKEGKKDALVNDAMDNGTNLGEYIFELLSGGGDDMDILLDYLED